MEIKKNRENAYGSNAGSRRILEKYMEDGKIMSTRIQAKIK
jgi:hypothetical protein